MKRKKKPKVTVVRKGSVAIKVYETRNGQYTRHEISYFIGDKKKRERLSDETEALKRAEELASSLSSGEITIASLTPADVASYARCRELAREVGKSLEFLVSFAVDTLKRRQHTPQPAGQMRTEMLAEMERDGASAAYIKAMRKYSGDFAEKFPTNFSAVTGVEMADWIMSLKKQDGTPISIRSRKNYRDVIAALARFGKRRGYVPKDWSEIDAITRPKIKPGNIDPFSPDELAVILAAAEGHEREAVRRILPWIVIRAFAGVREAEMCRVRGEDLHLGEDVIALGPEITKTARRRLIPIKPNLRKWLEPMKDRKGLLIPPKTKPTTAWSELLNELKLASRHNGLRDAYASYRMAEVNDAAKVADECGNSVEKLRTSYREIRLADGRIITSDMASKWFGIFPKTPPKS